ncbi:MAG: exo-alpha-sialidase [Thermoleophilaceae bacterium]|nr:exo-alpha-sialidase [Thermoleophilaceae bacterium]
MSVCRILVLASSLALLAGCGGNDDSSPAERAKIGDPGPVHVHGLGIDPRDGALFLATHTGLFRAPAGEVTAERVGDRFQDTMGFTVVGPNAFLGSGHPDGRDDLPPFLGLIRSDDGGRSWRSVSLLGERDFHVLESAGRRVYGFGSDFETGEMGFLVSSDGGRSWAERDVPEPLISLALDRRDPDRLVASGPRRLYFSQNGGGRWRQIDGRPGLVAWTDRLVVIDAKGTVHVAPAPGERPRAVGQVGGQPAALDTGPEGDGGLYVALHDGVVMQSRDGGASWSVRASA